VILLLLCGLAQAGATLGGDVKSFFLASFPYDSALLPEDPSGTGILSLRLKGEARQTWGQDSLAFKLHLASTLSAPASASYSGVSTSASAVPEAVDLRWDLDGGEGLAWTARPDWLLVEGRMPHLTLTLGRQPITFGHALLFTPLDLVAPFHPAVLDQEYKPGVDAARLDAYAGTSTHLSAVAAYAGSWDLDGLVLCATGQTTVGVWDLGLLAGAVHGDLVAGLTTTGSLGPIGLWAEGTLTVPTDDEDPFVRAVVGGEARPGDRWFLAAEAYVQTNGASDPGDYLEQSSGARYARGEVWEMGRYYAGLSGSYELSPIVQISAFALANLADPSAMVGPALSWSVSDEASVHGGAYVGLGQRPGDIDLSALGASDDLYSAIPVNSEFGLVPVVGFVSLSTAF